MYLGGKSPMWPAGLYAAQVAGRLKLCECRVYGAAALTGFVALAAGAGPHASGGRDPGIRSAEDIRQNPAGLVAQALILKYRIGDACEL